MTIPILVLIPLPTTISIPNPIGWDGVAKGGRQSFVISVIADQVFLFISPVKLFCIFTIAIILVACFYIFFLLVLHTFGLWGSALVGWLGGQLRFRVSRLAWVRAQPTRVLDLMCN